MLARRRLLAAVLPVCFLVVAIIGGTTSVAEAQDIRHQARTFINDLAGEAINALTAPGSNEQQRSRHFRQLLDKKFAVKTIARWVLGRHWRKASRAERAEYLRLFEKLLIVTYVHRFSSYSGETLKIYKTALNGKNDVIVFSRIYRSKSQSPIHVDWRVRDRKNNLKIIDVIVEGISMGQTQRSEFSSVIRQNGGKLEGLLAVLRKRTGDKSD